ncbi:hypothetical protein KP509_04G092700 [Ceratopteris richardii]|uniref:BHLH domain-containing protein n=1 Tax=Ceratopteris richardii TaxID=49495 RepID=A0A8T2UZI4_CERRI|nr:hypothetical protein KP509_04G092700 [Ceratopteris richardii]
MNQRSSVSGPGSPIAGDHLRRLVQSSALRNEHDIQQQFTQFLSSQGHERQPLPNKAIAEPPRVHSTSRTTTPDLSKDYLQAGKPVVAYPEVGGKTVDIFPSLTRYHSAPTSTPGSISDIGNVIPNPDLAQFFPENATFGIKNRSRETDTFSAALRTRDHGKMEAISADRNPNHHSDLGHSLPLQLVSDRETPSQRSIMNAEHTRSIRIPNGRLEAMDPELSGFCQGNDFFHKNANVGAFTGPIQTVSSVKDGLLRHASSPAGFLSRLNDNQERPTLASSSGYSSEDADYEKQERYRRLREHLSADERKTMMHEPCTPRKRIRNSGEKLTSSASLENQKSDPLEHRVASNYFSLQPYGIKDKNAPQSESVACHARAKRGCATHPRSIAERVRRTKISERMKKLQELVPNIDKQANISEMLDEAVEYVRSLQEQVQLLTEKRARCKCKNRKRV